MAGGIAQCSERQRWEESGVIAVLKFLVFGHLHKWTTIREDKATWDNGSTGRMYTCQCTTCGKIKAFTVRP